MRRRLHILGLDAIRRRRCARAASARGRAVASGAALRMKASKCAASLFWMSTKKNAGALSGRVAGIAGAGCRRSAPRSPAPRGPGRARARPRASARRDDGYWRWRAAKRSARARQPSRRQHDEGGDQPQRNEGRGGRGDENRGDPLVVGEQNGERGEPQRHDGRGSDIWLARPALPGVDCVAEQRRDRNVMRAAERPDRKSQRRQQAEQSSASASCAGMQRGLDRQRNDCAERRRKSRTARPRRGQARCAVPIAAIAITCTR